MTFLEELAELAFLLQLMTSQITMSSLLFSIFIYYYFTPMFKLNDSCAVPQDFFYIILYIHVMYVSSAIYVIACFFINNIISMIQWRYFGWHILRTTTLRTSHIMSRLSWIMFTSQLDALRDWCASVLY